jgi:hypothetical protein
LGGSSNAENGLSMLLTIGSKFFSKVPGLEEFGAFFGGLSAATNFVEDSVKVAQHQMTRAQFRGAMANDAIQLAGNIGGFGLTKYFTGNMGNAEKDLSNVDRQLDKIGNDPKNFDLFLPERRGGEANVLIPQRTISLRDKGVEENEFRYLKDIRNRTIVKEDTLEGFTKARFNSTDEQNMLDRFAKKTGTTFTDILDNSQDSFFPSVRFDFTGDVDALQKLQSKAQDLENDIGYFKSDLNKIRIALVAGNLVTGITHNAVPGIRLMSTGVSNAASNQYSVNGAS